MRKLISTQTAIHSNVRLELLRALIETRAGQAREALERLSVLQGCGSREFGAQYACRYAAVEVRGFARRYSCISMRKAQMSLGNVVAALEQLDAADSLPCAPIERILVSVQCAYSQHTHIPPITDLSAALRVSRITSRCLWEH